MRGWTSLAEHPQVNLRSTAALDAKYASHCDSERPFPPARPRGREKSTVAVTKAVTIRLRSRQLGRDPWRKVKTREMLMQADSGSRSVLFRSTMAKETAWQDICRFVSDMSAIAHKTQCVGYFQSGISRALLIPVLGTGGGCLQKGVAACKGSGKGRSEDREVGKRSLCWPPPVFIAVS